jgi:methyl-accepting chemotaxis protein
LSKLDALVHAGPIFQSIFPIDCEVLVVDAKGVFQGITHAKTFTVKAEIGDTAQQGGAIQESLATRKQVAKILPKELYGTMVKSISCPIIENGELIGATAVFISLTNQHSLQETAQAIAATSQEMTATSEELAATAATLSNTLNDLKELGHGVITEIKQTDEILKFVSDVAVNSNLLGLNAAIEAARAGELGRGFAVVADEIRKMADNSSRSVTDIRSIIDNIQTRSIKIIDGVSNASQIGEQQALAAQEIASAMEQLARAAGNVEKIAEIL